MKLKQGAINPKRSGWQRASARSQQTAPVTTCHSPMIHGSCIDIFRPQLAWPHARFTADRVASKCPCRAQACASCFSSSASCRFLRSLSTASSWFCCWRMDLLSGPPLSLSPYQKGRYITYIMCNTGKRTKGPQTANRRQGGQQENKVRFGGTTGSIVRNQIKKRWVNSNLHPMPRSHACSRATIALRTPHY